MTSTGCSAWHFPVRARRGSEASHHRHMADGSDWMASRRRAGLAMVRGRSVATNRTTGTKTCASRDRCPTQPMRVISTQPRNGDVVFASSWGDMPIVGYRKMWLKVAKLGDLPTACAAPASPVLAADRFNEPTIASTGPHDAHCQPVHAFRFRHVAGRSRCRGECHHEADGRNARPDQGFRSRIVGEHRHNEAPGSAQLIGNREHRTGMILRRGGHRFTTNAGIGLVWDNAVSIEAANDDHVGNRPDARSRSKRRYLNRANRAIARGEIVLRKLPKFRCVLIQINRHEHQTG